jgi:hypothetical protein
MFFCVEYKSRFFLFIITDPRMRTDTNKRYRTLNFCWLLTDPRIRTLIIKKPVPHPEGMYICDKINANRSKIAVFFTVLVPILISTVVHLVNFRFFSEHGSDPRIRTPNGTILHRKKLCLYAYTSDKNIMWSICRNFRLFYLLYVKREKINKHFD